jgi:biofilm protein TabA
MRRRDLVVGLMASGLLSRLAIATDSETITGQLDQWKKLPSTKGMEPALEYLAQLDPSRVTPGRTPIIGDEVYAVASQYTTKAAEAPRFEAHRKYIDIQYIVSGQETIGFLPAIEGLVVLEPYNTAKDVEFYAAPASYTRLPVKGGQFAILRPGQAHMPGCHLDGPHDIVKVVVKVSAAWHAARGA